MYLLAVCLFTSGVAAVILWYLSCSVDKPHALHGRYTQPGRLFVVKKWMMYCILKIQRKLVSRDPRLETVEKIEKDIKVKRTCLVSGVEYPQPLPEEPEAFDLVCFNGVGSDGACVTMRIERRQHNAAQPSISVSVPEVGCFRSPASAETVPFHIQEKSFVAKDLCVRCVTPHKQWEISFKGLLRRELDNEQSTSHKDNDDELVHVEFLLLWTAVSDPFNFDTEFDPWLTADAIARESWTTSFWQNLSQDKHTHYEQWGEIEGIVKIEGLEERKLELKACKNHSFGLQSKESVHRSVAHYGYVEDGTSFNLTAVSLRSTTNLQCGYVNGSSSCPYPVSWTDIDLPNLGEQTSPPKCYPVSFIANGASYTVTVNAHTSFLCNGSSHSNGALYQMACHLLVNGKKGWGVVEFFNSEQSVLNQKNWTDEVH